MKYKPTPFNLASIVLVIWAVWTYSSHNDPEGWGLLSLIVLFVFIVIALGVDIIIQKFSKKYVWTFIIEITILGAMGLFFLSTKRTQTLILSEDVNKRTFVTIIYNVDSANELPLNSWTLQGEIEIPNSQILLTSSTYNTNLPQTDIRLKNDKQKQLGFGRFSFDTFILGNRTYRYRTWLIDSNCCMYTSKEIEKHREDLKHYLEKINLQQKPNL